MDAEPIVAVSGERPAWLLRTARTATLLSLGPDGALLLDHWGPDRGGWGPGDFVRPMRPAGPFPGNLLDAGPLAYPAYGDGSFREPCLCAVYHDGTRAVRLAFRDAHVTSDDGKPALDLEFADAAYGLVVAHRFVVEASHDIVRRRVRLVNEGARPVTIERALSGGLALPSGSYDAWTLHGGFVREFELHRRPLQPGAFATGSTRGLTSHQANPWFAVTPSGAGPTEAVACWVGALAWSGNWTMTFEVASSGAVGIVAGLSPFDFSWHLAPGESFETPELVSAYTDEGLDGAARLLHRYEREAVLPAAHHDEPRPVLYNSWGGTHFDISVGQQVALARRAAEMGVELFVVDDGWFGARDDATAGLGDWVVNRGKFPNGLGELIDEVRRLGMRFGIWVEPEMVNPDSDLYRAHPDWALHFPGREPLLRRNQLVLNFAREDVRENILGQLRRLLADHQIDFVKWDCNRPITDPGWPEAPRVRQREVWVRHVRGVYAVLAALRAEFPHVIVESCASGGGRVDLGILRLTDQVWTSDNTRAADRLPMHYGYSRAYAPLTMVDWVEHAASFTGRVESLPFRFHLAMQGVLGVGGDVMQWTEEELAQAKEHVAAYKRIRPIVQLGVQHWLLPPEDDRRPCAVQYVSRDGSETVVLAYQLRARMGQGTCRVRLRGLHPARRYRRESDGAESVGAALMCAGAPILAAGFRPGDWQSELQHWIAVA